ncbi:MAG: hypothetical protein AVDCRST_MAG26-3419, partial [uncultured Chloroflexia bacterium]
ACRCHADEICCQILPHPPEYELRDSIPRVGVHVAAYRLVRM